MQEGVSESRFCIEIQSIFGFLHVLSVKREECSTMIFKIIKQHISAQKHERTIYAVPRPSVTKPILRLEKS